MSNHIYTRPLTPRERALIYCAMNACPQCGQGVGHFCLNGRGGVWTTNYHWMRTPFACLKRLDGESMIQWQERKRLCRLEIERRRQQLDDAKEIPGHE